MASFCVIIGIFGDRIPGPIFFDGRLDSGRYLRFLQEVLQDMLDEESLARIATMWYQHDGAPVHHTRAVRNYLQQQFWGRVIARQGQDAPVFWPARSPDLSPLDLFLWGHLKAVVYAAEPRTQQELKDRIVDACRAITPVTLGAVRDNMLLRVQKCTEVHGQHFEQLL